MKTRAEDSTAATALGAALLAAAIAVVSYRLDEQWGDGIHLALTAAGSAGLVLGGLARTRRRSGDGPAPDASALLLAGLAVWAIADFRLLEVLTEGEGEVFDRPRSLTAYFVLLTAVAAVCWVRSRSAACLLVTALAAGGTALAAVRWAFDTENIASYRPVLLVLATLYAAAAWAFNERPRDRDVLVDAAGLAILAISLLNGGLLFIIGAGRLPDAWEAVLLAGAVGLAVYTARTRAPGPGLLAVLVFAAFVVAASAPPTDFVEPLDGVHEGTTDTPDLMGWPLVLLALSLLALGYGMLSGRRNRDHDPDRAVQPSH